MRLVLKSVCAMTALAGALAAAAWAEAPVSQAEKACSALAGVAVKDMTVDSAVLKAANSAGNVPAHCEVTATLRPVKGSAIGIVIRLPEGWNGKLLGLGGGGWAGNVTLAYAAPNLAAGYATAQTDGGHAEPNAWNTDWATLPNGKPNMVALEDFSHRAIHLTTVAAKQLIAAYYGKPQSRAYFHGCSTGGRMALMEAQRYPEDYDGIIAGAPVYTLRTQSTSLLRSVALLGPNGHLSDAQISRIGQEVIKACDGNDGITDGIIGDPMSCTWDPAVLQCPASGGGADCLSPGQVKTVRTLYDGIKTRAGDYAGYPLLRGTEPQWSGPFVGGRTDAARGGMTGLRHAMMGDPAFDLDHYDAEKDQKTLENSLFAKIYQANNPDIARFTARGGKLILWHGTYDPGPSPVATIDYYQQMLRAMQGKLPAGSTKLEDHARLFIAPGVGHCRGGPGADRFDLVGALDAWVEKGTTPDRITASRADTPMTRPLCPYPSQPRHTGKGNPNDAANFTCG